MRLTEFTVTGPPKQQQRHRTVRVGKVNRRIVQYDPSKQGKDDFLVMAMEARPQEPWTEPVTVDIDCYFMRPKTHRNRKGKLKPGAPWLCTKTPDADNLGKFVLDALNGIFWADDKYVTTLIVNKYWADKGPYTHVKIYSCLATTWVTATLMKPISEKPLPPQ